MYVCVCRSTSNWNEAMSHTTSLTCPHAGNCRDQGYKSSNCIVSKDQEASIGIEYICVYIFHKQAFILSSQRGKTRSGHWCSFCLYVRTCSVCTCAHMPVGNTRSASCVFPQAGPGDVLLQQFSFVRLADAGASKTKHSDLSRA